jgi:hypothetical protein
MFGGWYGGCGRDNSGHWRWCTFGDWYGGCGRDEQRWRRWFRCYGR